MRLTITETIEVPASPERVFDYTNQPEAFVGFVGYGPIPGIRSAEYTTSGPPGLGSRRRVSNTDGSSHMEEITRFVPPERHTARIHDIRSPFRLLVRWLDDDWRFASSARGTRIERTFVVDARPLALPVAAVLVPFLRRAIRRDLANLVASIESQA